MNPSEYFPTHLPDKAALGHNSRHPAPDTINLAPTPSTCGRFMPNDAMDPDFAKALCQSQSQGVELCAYTCKISIGEIEIDKRMDILL